MKIKYFMIILLSFTFFTFASANSDADCIILEDEDSIICKYTHTRVDYDKKITVQWIEPNEQITREREMIIPSNHGSIYDFRYKQGRTKGVWTFKVIDKDVDEEYTTNFTIE
jgi:hypothetical protein